MEFKIFGLSILCIACLMVPVRSAGILESKLEAIRTVKNSAVEGSEHLIKKGADVLMNTTAAVLNAKGNLLKDILSANVNAILDAKGAAMKGIISAKGKLISKILDALIDAKIRLIKPVDAHRSEEIPPPPALPEMRPHEVPPAHTSEKDPKPPCPPARPHTGDVIVEVRPPSTPASHPPASHPPSSHPPASHPPASHPNVECDKICNSQGMNSAQRGMIGTVGDSLKYATPVNARVSRTPGHSQ